MSKRPTQKDVGRLAGVSRATVSYVINNRAGGTVRISETTRRRVWDAVEELGYQPNVTARSLRTRRTQLMAVTASMGGRGDPHRVSLEGRRYSTAD